MDDDQKGLLYLFERPFDLLKIPRARGSILFQQIGDEDEELANRFGSATMMNVPTMAELMGELDMDAVKQVPRGVPFSQFNPQHIAAAKELTKRFLDPKIVDMKLCWNAAASVKDSVNEELFIYALSFVIIKNPAFDSRLVPAITEVFPGKFIPQETLDKAVDQLKRANMSNPEAPPKEIVIKHDIDFTGSNRNPEHHVAYWREDYGLNSHHWHWHLVFGAGSGRDRKGELFFYMHNQMLTRYDWERLSNSLDPVMALGNWHEAISEGYFSNLTINNSSSQYGGRPDNMILRNHSKIKDMEEWRVRLFDAIDRRYMINENDEHVQLSDNVSPGEKRGIDILGDAVEADWDLSVDNDFYGSLHNEGHVLIAGIHDPDRNHNVPLGVMGTVETACRDPVFYRWHKFVDHIFQKYKMQQDPYEEKELIFESVEVESVTVKSDLSDENILETGWTYRTIDTSRGLDFGTVPGIDGENDQQVHIQLQHLTSRPFTYNIQVTNNQAEPVDVTIRLFMAPKLNATGETMTFTDQKLLWGEMDKYKTTLQPGSNSLERLSTESSITISEERTFRDIEENTPKVENPDYCGCGWPQHLLLPKGTTEGMDFQIFALVSDWELDKVEASAGERTCSNAASFCGILNDKYPDARPMGYPFDRRPTATVNNVDITNAIDFANALPNASMSDIKIYFRDTDLSPE